MGCDVHLYAEIKVNGQWLLYTQPKIERCYAMFEKMAGVRGEPSNAIALPRGLPADISPATRFCADYDGTDGHSHSWLNAAEIRELVKWGETELRPRASHMNRWDFEAETGAYLFGNGWAGFVSHPDSRPAGVEDVRWVFWFDN